MSAQPIDALEVIIDLADELTDEPNLTAIQLGEPGRGSQPQNILQVWARDIARLSNQSFPSIQVLGAKGDMVQLSDYNATCHAATWQRQLRDPDYPGVTVYSCYQDGKLVQLVVQDGISVYDADGARV